MARMEAASTAKITVLLSLRVQSRCRRAISMAGPIPRGVGRGLGGVVHCALLIAAVVAQGWDRRRSTGSPSRSAAPKELRRRVKGTNDRRRTRSSGRPRLRRADQAIGTQLSKGTSRAPVPAWATLSLVRGPAAGYRQLGAAAPSGPTVEEPSNWGRSEPWHSASTWGVIRTLRSRGSRPWADLIAVERQGPASMGEALEAVESLISDPGPPLASVSVRRPGCALCSRASSGCAA